MSGAAGRPITVLFLDLNPGWRGGQRQQFWLAERLKKLGHRPILGLRSNAQLKKRGEEVGIETFPINPKIPEMGPWTVMRLRRFIRRERVDIVHPQGGHDIALAALATLGTRAKIVIARRVSFPLKTNVGTRWKYRRADHVIGVCREAVDTVVARGVEPERVSVVHSGVILPKQVTPLSAEELAAFGVPAGAPLVVMAAAIERMKDPLAYVRAVAVARRTVPTLHALLVGEGSLAGEVTALANELGIGDAVHLTGFRWDADRFLASATVVALSSVPAGEGIAGVLIDAISLGRPVAAFNVGGVSEVIDDGVSGFLVQPRDVEGLGAAIARIASDPALAARMGAAGLAKSPAFDIERTVARTIEVYERVLGRTGAPQHGGLRAAAPG